MKIAFKNYRQEIALITDRIKIAGFIMSVCLLLLIGRLYFLHIHEYKHYQTLSKQNALDTIPLAPRRGLIYDRNGKVLAKNVTTYSLEIIPAKITNLNDTLADLQSIIGFNQSQLDRFYRLKYQTNKYKPVPLRTHLSPEEVAKFYVYQYRFPGISIHAHLSRYYPQGKDFAHALGYVGRINNREEQQVDKQNYLATNTIGKTGIEKHYESQLHGTVGYATIEKDASGRIIRQINRHAPVPGEDIYLTLDANIQKAAVKALGKHRGAVVVTNPNNGEVLALVSTPTFDPNLFVDGISQKDYSALHDSDDQPLYNRAIRGTYPLASTIKPYIGLDGLDTQTITPSYTYNDPGWFKLKGSSHIFHDWKRGGHGVINLDKAITVSCDTYFYNLANMLGIKSIDTLLAKFGFGTVTGIDLDEEITGILPTPEWKKGFNGKSWYPGDTLLTGIGQGYIQATPLQLANAVSMLSEHGKRYQIHLLKGQQKSGQQEKDTKITQYASIELRDKNEWNTITTAMTHVITAPDGTGHRFGNPSKYTVAAKTGTAQVSHQSRLHLNANLPEKLRDHSLFIAFAPVKHPQIAIAVVVEHSEEAPAVARKVMDAYFNEANKPHINAIKNNVIDKTNNSDQQIHDNTDLARLKNQNDSSFVKSTNSDNNGLAFIKKSDQNNITLPIKTKDNHLSFNKKNNLAAQVLLKNIFTENQAT